MFKKNLFVEKQHYRVWELDAFSLVLRQIDVFVVALSEHRGNILHGVGINVERTIVGGRRVKLVLPFAFKVHSVSEYECR